MTTNVAIVDGSDPRIQYVGPWNDAGIPEEFNGTTKWAAKQGSTASFTFNGSSVIVFGTVAPSNPPGTSLNFVVDDYITGTYTAPNLLSIIHHEALWTSPTMNDTSHTLVVTQTTAQLVGVIFLDYIMYNTTSSAGSLYFVDDRDPRIEYTSAWRKSGSDLDFQHTSQGSTQAGDSLTFPCEGKSISFYGDINNSSVGNVLNASIVIDGGQPVFYSPGLPSAALASNNLIFDSGDLEQGNHTLVVTVENYQPLWVDYFLVAQGTSLASTPAVPSAPLSTPSISAQSSSKSISSGMVVGVVIAGLFVVAIGVAAALLSRRRRNSKIHRPEERSLLNISTLEDGSDRPPEYSEF